MGMKKTFPEELYKIFGIQKEPCGSGVGTYSFKRGVSDDDKDQLNRVVKTMCKQL